MERGRQPVVPLGALGPHCMYNATVSVKIISEDNFFLIQQMQVNYFFCCSSIKTAMYSKVRNSLALLDLFSMFISHVAAASELSSKEFLIQLQNFNPPALSDAPRKVRVQCSFL